MARLVLDPSFADSDDNFDEVDDIVLADAHSHTPSASPGSGALASPSESDCSESTLSTGDLDSRSDISAASSSISIASKTRYLFPKIDTVESLRPEEVRWFYKEDGEKKWAPFIGYDSLRIECKFREIIHRLGHLASSDNQPEALEDDNELINVRGGIYEVNVLKRKCLPVYWSIKEQSTSVMRGTWFVDGTWQPLDEHHSNQIETEHLSKFENQRIPEDEEASRGPLPVVHHLQFKQFHVDWNAINRVFLHSEATSSKLYRAVGTKLGLAKSGTRLHRGYCYEAHMDDKPPDITHLIFVVHGIGQKMDTGNIVKRCADIRESTRRVCEKYFTTLTANNKRAEFLPVEWRSTLRLDGDTVESITPNKVKGLRTILNSSAMDILYYTSPLYRSEITQCLQEELNRLYVMFCNRHPYFEASGGKVSILAHSLGSVIAYDIITGWNPIHLYDQYVSRVIDDSKDEAQSAINSNRQSAIIGNQMFVSVCDKSTEEKFTQVESTSSLVTELEEARQRVHELENEILKKVEKERVKTPTLKFTLDSFFSFGSPLAVFLALRGIRPIGKGTQDHILPISLCRRLYNIYHPSDPIAYRLEPLILKHYEGIMPLRIHRFDSPNKSSYDDMPLTAIAAVNSKPASRSTSADTIAQNKEKEKEKEEPVVQNDKESSSVKRSWSNVFRRNKQPSVEETLTAEMTVLEKQELPKEDLEEEEWVKYDVKFEKSETELEYRLDYQVKEGKMENSYLATLTSHFSYWSNIDVALFILTQIFPDLAPS